MILELDLGNTHGKWRLLGTDDVLLDRGTGTIDAWVDGELPSAWMHGVRRVRAASVLDPSVNYALADRLAQALSIRMEFAVSTAHCAGVRNVYSEPAKLGVDRWLAMIAAYRAFQSAVLVVDAGSALTVDVVDEAGRHCGGYIIPGTHLMERALLEGTDRVRFEFGIATDFDLGANTGACVRNGIVAAQCGAVLVALSVAKKQLAVDLPLVLSGGWALPAADCLALLGIADINVVPDLVFDGLRWALPD